MKQIEIGESLTTFEVILGTFSTLLLLSTNCCSLCNILAHLPSCVNDDGLVNDCLFSRRLLQVMKCHGNVFTCATWIINLHLTQFASRTDTGYRTEVEFSSIEFQWGIFVSFKQVFIIIPVLQLCEWFFRYMEHFRHWISKSRIWR